MPSFGSTTPQGEGGQPGKWIKLDSSSINSVAFNSEDFTLKVYFNDGDTWVYKDVPFVKFKRLVYSGSSGSYLRKEIIPHHDAEKVNDGAPDDITDGPAQS